MSSVSIKTKSIIGLAILVVIVGGVTFFGKEKAGSFSGTMFELFDRGGDWKCVWEQAGDDFTAQGTTLIAGKKFKSDAISSSGEVTLTTHMLGDGEFFYAWTSIAPIGVRMELDTLKQQSEVQTPQATELGKEYTFDCQPFNSDDSVFAIPMDVAFSPVLPAEQ